MPVNSPVYYPTYNGAIEEAQAELKNGLTAKLSYKPCCPREHLEAYASTELSMILITNLVHA